MSKKIFTCIDGHTCGNPVRLVVDGAPILEGKDMSEKRQFFLKNFDWIRKGLMFEPRGHDMMSGAMIYPPHNPKNDCSILFIETSGCLPMCGHGTIGAVTIAIEEKIIKPKTDGTLRIETPAGTIEINYLYKNGKVKWVEFTNVGSYLCSEDLNVISNDLGDINFDVSYGGNFYAIIDYQKNFSGIQDYSANDIIKYSHEIRKKINLKYPDKFIHPIDPTIRDVSHILWVGDKIDLSSSSRNAVFYGDKAIDRSPCGTGTSARMAQMYFKGKLCLNEEFVHESYIGSKFIGTIKEESVMGLQKIIIPKIKGWARIHGYNKIIIDNDDHYAHGFQVI
ncbi:MAG TPA: 4-hydroxyproline epimerase [Flavobacteriaceae bacterium]|nr:4-hydroxyproline epimerase [Flavobacteriaceae bacterium]